MKIAKYFWDLNQEAYKDLKKVLNDPKHPKFAARMVTLLSRCDKPKELFSLISKKKFVRAWPSIRAYWAKRRLGLDFRDWWETIYEEMTRQDQGEWPKAQGAPPELFIKIGGMIRQRRIAEGLSQKDVAARLGMRQPDISKIEEGKKNITLFTLMKLCRILKIEKIDM
ncbi:MAG: helix-turn-helix transcriptional regulator [Candidatus Omnitrophota bacterium]